MTTRILNWSQATESEREKALERPAMSVDADIRTKAADIIAEVRERGDATLIDLAARFDGVELAGLTVDDEEAAWAEQQLPASAIDAIDLAIRNVRRFHEAQKPARVDVETMAGVRCERIWHPLESVGLYVPAGTAPLPSAAIMLSVPAAIAGVPDKVLCTPPRPDGRADPAVIVAARRAGVDRIVKAGGAQAVAAMAYGTETVPKSLKIFGPGNAWVTAAKGLVSSDPAGAAIDLPAGPSEVLVIADESANVEFVASDLLSQAEHGEDSQVVLVTTSDRVARAVQDELENQLALLSRADIARVALSHSRLVIVDSLADAVLVSNRYAPEHLILQTENARELVADLRNAGSIFVGPWTPESVGDYCSGTNHVLPTYGFAKNYSGLGLDQFIRYTTVQELERSGLENLGDAVIELAGLEGLDAHAAAVTRRLESGA